jgi:hypothetical protein
MKQLLILLQVNIRFNISEINSTVSNVKKSQAIEALALFHFMIKLIKGIIEIAIEVFSKTSYSNSTMLTI